MAGRGRPHGRACQPAAGEPVHLHRRPERQRHPDHAGDDSRRRQQRCHARRLDDAARLRRPGAGSAAERAVAPMAVKARQALLFAGIAAGAAAIVVAAFHNLSNLTRMELFTDDVRTVASTYMHHEPQDPRVVIVAITEDTLTQFPYRSPVDRAFLANLLRILQDRGAKVVGLDVLFDQPTEPEKDAELQATIAGLKV